MTDRELKPCPFCGSEDVRFPESIGEPPYNACRLCGSMALITKWNSRPIEDALRAEVEMRGDQVSALMGQVAQYMAEAQTLRAENDRLREALAKRDEPLRPELASFATAMEAKLRENDHKGGWAGCDEHWLMERLYEEADELCDAINKGTHVAVVSEAADVANFAMMIADIAAIRRVRGEG